MATLRDVANAAGVSTATVSNVFNATGRVSPGVRDRVLVVAGSLGYAGPNPAAASLRRGRSGLLGVVFGEGLTYAFDDPAASAFLAGVGDEGQAGDVGLTLLPVPTQTGRGATRTAGLAALERAVVDGFLLYSLDEDHPALASLLRRGVPLVAVDAPEEFSGDPWACRVDVDDRAAAYDVGVHVTALGHRRAVVLTDRLGAIPRIGPASWERGRSAPSPVLRRRILGYTDAWLAAGLDPGDLTIEECGANTSAAAQQRTHRLLAQAARPTAVLAATDVLAVGALHAARALGLGVPGQVSVAGFDDGPLAGVQDPPLTTVRQPLRDKGRVAARALIGALAGVRQTSVVLPAALVVRASTGPAPAG